MKTTQKLITISLLSITSFLFGCTEVNNSNPSSTTDSSAFTILAGSEIKDIEPILKQASKELGFPIQVSYTGTIDGVTQIKDGLKIDAGWFSQSKYFYDTPENAKRIKLSEKTMLSPVAVGVRESSWKKLNIKDSEALNWKDISKWVTTKQFTYAMTDPSESNTGYVALMGIAYSIAGTGENLKISDIKEKNMKDFFQGHKVNSGSSSWLVSAFSQSKVDFMINYESILLQYNKNNPQDQLHIVYPQEGIVTSDYPILLINPQKTEQYKKLAEYLKSKNTQTNILNTTFRRSINSEVMASQNLINNEQLLIEMPFTPSPTISEELLVAYYNNFKKPSAFFFVLDTSGSMNKAGRDTQMKNAIASLTVNVPTNSRFARLRDREKLWILPFADKAYDLKSYDITKNPQTLSDINNYTQALVMDGRTALFDSTLTAFEILQQEQIKHPSYQYSVIVLTDGDNTMGINAQEFINRVSTKNMEKGSIKVFPILFGDGSPQELNLIAESTGGKVFDARSKSLNNVFKEIRSYQ